MAITVQSNYAEGYVRGLPGMVGNGEKSNRISRTIEDAAGLAFGKAGFRGAGDHGITGTPAAGTFMGIAILDRGIVPATVSGTVDVYPQYSSVGLLNEGLVCVIVAVNVSDGEAVYVTSAGAFTNVSAGNIAIPAVFDETVASGGVCMLRVRRS